MRAVSVEAEVVAHVVGPPPLHPELFHAAIDCAHRDDRDQLFRLIATRR